MCQAFCNNDNCKCVWIHNMFILTINNVRNERLSRISNWFFFVNVNDIYFICLNFDNRCKYYIANNVNLINWTFNNFCDFWFKIILSLVQIFKKASIVQKLNYVAIAIRNFVVIKREISKTIRNKYKFQVIKQRINEFHEFMRTTQFFSILYKNRSLNIIKKMWFCEANKYVIKIESKN